MSGEKPMSTITNDVNENKIESLTADLASDHGMTRRHAREFLVALGEPAVALDQGGVEWVLPMDLNQETEAMCQSARVLKTNIAQLKLE
jgi:hypothetical protein